MARIHHPLSRKYTTQKSNAKRRGIAFKLTFTQWLSIWEASGCVNKMGRRRYQYCMARYNDKGAYTVGNVHIVTMRQNRLQLGVDVRQQMSLSAKQRCARTPTQEMKRKMALVAAARDMDKFKKAVTRAGKRLWASMTVAERSVKMKKMIDARWRRT